ncbi:MAG: nucleotidyltransferase domain-containing protein [Sulfuricellaceae bacterium]|nr:nucleotidyltransferase domain-containing protein [Sulfuricellaceae bacterium]
MMRLTDQQRTIIRATVAETFGTGANVWLFGSRVDDNKRGGDIDLLIETDQVDVAAIARTEIAFLTKIQMKLGEQKIDVLLDYPSRKTRQPIFFIAKQTGVLL